MTRPVFESGLPLAPMAFHIATVEEADLPELAMLSQMVWNHQPSTLLNHMFPADKHAERYDYRLARLRIAFKEDFVLHFKMVDLSSNNIVSYASWDVPRPAVPDGDASDDESAKRPPKAMYPEGCNLAMIEEFYQERDRIADSHVNKTQDYVLRVLFTHPGYQSRGLASMMLRRMLERIDAERRRCYLEATPAGYPLYLKFGWKVVDEVRTDLAKYGAKDAPVELTPCMMRDASSLLPK